MKVKIKNKDKLAKALIKYRCENNLTIPELANKCNLSLSLLSKLENGKVEQVNALTFYKIAKEVKEVENL